MTTAEVAPLDSGEASALSGHETIIERGLNAFVEVGSALVAIRDGCLYRGTHDTFEDYCRLRWNMSRAHAYRMIDAAAVVSPIGDTDLPLPANEGQARELGRVPEGQREDVWRETVERTNGKPTAAAVRDTYRATATADPWADGPFSDMPQQMKDDIDHMRRNVDEPIDAEIVSEKPAPRRKPITEQADVLGQDFRKAAERLHRIVTDDRFKRNEEQVALSLRGHLLFARQTLAEALELIGE